MKIKIRYWFYFPFIICTVFWFGGCAYTTSPVQGFLYTNVKKPVTYNSAGQNLAYTVIGEVEGRSQATSILGIIATGNASVRLAYERAISKIPDTEGLIDISIDQSFNSFLGLSATTTTILRAKAVKWISNEQTTKPPYTFETTDMATTSSSPVKRKQPGVDFSSMTPFFKQGNPTHNINISLSNLAGKPGGTGFRFGYQMRRKGFDFTFNPAVSIGLVKRERDFSYPVYEYNYETYRSEKIMKKVKEKINYNVIPVELNFSVNSGFFQKRIPSLPISIEPYAEAGLVYYIWKSSGEFDAPDTIYDGESWDGDWDFFEMGLVLGVGLEYSIKPNLALQSGIKRHIVFDKDFDFWNYQLGVTFSPK